MQPQTDNPVINPARTPVISFMSRFMETLNAQEEIELVPYSQWSRDRLAKLNAAVTGDSMDGKSAQVL